MADETKPILLPDNIIPLHYDWEVELELEKFEFSGKVEIEVSVVSGSTITLHSLELSYSENPASIKFSDKEIKSKNTTLDEKEETVTFDFGDLPSNQVGVLTIQYRGILNDKMAGLYRSQYKDSEGNKKYCACTQMEPADCRRALPCFDEPARKATFSVAVVFPAHMIALSNMPAIETKKLESGMNRTNFEKTPLMSSYLLALVVGEFDYLEKKTKNGVQVRVYTERGKQDQGAFALEMAADTLDFFTEYFDIGYPLPKSDMVAISDFAAGAMENWGLITYRETALLIGTSSPLSSKQRVAYVVAHELAHQWFGNLVTPEWWRDLWLNEGFATWVGYLAVVKQKPEWDYWTAFCASSVSGAFSLDALETSHPIEVNVARSSEINEIFDAISYHKGASVIRMLATYLGEDAFRQGLRAYLKKHQFKNAATHHLWEALSESSGKDVSSFMKKWTGSMGFPVLLLEQNGDSLVIKQERFLSSGIKEGESAWEVPVHLLNGSKSIETTLRDKSAVVQLPSSEDFVLANPTYFGFYRTSYQKPMMDKICKAIQEKKIEPLDRLGFVSDAFAVARAGLLPLSAFLDVLPSGFAQEMEESVWQSICTSLALISYTLIDSELSEKWSKFLAELASPAFATLGWDPKPEEPVLHGLLRGKILALMGQTGNPEVVEKAIQMVKDGVDISPNIISTVYKTAASKGGKEIFDILFKKFQEASMHEESVRCLGALACSNDEECLKNLLEMSLDISKIRSSDSYLVFVEMGKSASSRDLAWNFLVSRWEEVERVLGGISHLFHRLIGAAISHFSDVEKANEIEEFFKAHPIGERRTLNQAIESIRNNAIWKGRDRAGLVDFLAKY